jgi:hypothetical protein
VATVRVIAGSFNGVQGTASTFTPINLWDVSLAANQSMDLATIEGHTTIIFCRTGSLRVNPEVNTASIKSAQIAILSREGNTIRLESGTEGVQFMVLDGEPIKEPIAARGPFVMNTDAELRQAIADYQAGRMGWKMHCVLRKRRIFTSSGKKLFLLYKVFFSIINKPPLLKIISHKWDLTPPLQFCSGFFIGIICDWIARNTLIYTAFFVWCLIVAPIFFI